MSTANDWKDTKTTDSRGNPIRIGDRARNHRTGEIGFVQACSRKRSYPVIRISDREFELDIGDFGWSEWVKPDQLTVLVESATEEASS